MEEYNRHTGKLFIISGPSGAGKGTICQRLVGDLDVELSISATTRKPRKGEVDGINYYFLDRDEFVNRVKNNGFLEYAEVYENFYGTPRDYVIGKLESGIDVILEIDIQGAMKVKENYPKGVFIFILPPNMDILRRRLTGRGTDSEETINLRMSKTLSELSFIEKYDYCVVNGDLDEAVKRVEAILMAEHSRVAGDVSEIIKKYEGGK